MKNLKTNTQASARNLFTSCLCGLSSAVLASSFALFAPSASAFTLVDSDEDGYLEGVTGVNVAGSDYDVEFKFGTFDEVYNDGGSYDFTFDSVAEVDQAFDAIFAGIENSAGQFVGYEQTGNTEIYGEYGDGDYNLYIGYDELSYARYSWLGAGGNFASTEEGVGSAAQLVYAVFSQSAPRNSSGENGTASTPEPSLILGFITLGGLMLGSKRKTKG